MKSYMVLIKLLFLGALFIISNHNLHMGVDVERDEFYMRFNNWMSGMYDQIIEITGYVAKSEWLPGVNSSFDSELERIRGG